MMFRTSIQILIVSVVLLSPGWARASTVNRLTQIRVNEQKSATVITVSGSTQPSFTVFKLINPIRIFVDVANADVRSIADSITVENGVIGQVGALSVRNGTTRIGRIVVTLNRSNFYQVKAVGTEIQIVIEANGRKSRQPTMKLETQRLKLQMLSREILRERELLEKLRGARAKEEQLKSQAETARRREEELRQKLESERKRAEQLRLLAERAKNTVLLAKTKVEKELHNQRQLKRETELARKKEEQRLALLASLVQKKREQQLSLQKAADAQRQRIEALKTQKHQLEAMKKAAIALRLAEEQRKKLAKTSAEIEERKRQAARTARLIEEKVKLSLLQTRKQMEAKIALLRMANRLELERQKALREKRQREELRQKFLIDAVARYKKMAAELQVARTKQESAKVKRLVEQLAALKTQAKKTALTHQQKIAELAKLAQLKAAKLRQAAELSKKQKAELQRLLADRASVLKQAQIANRQLQKIEAEHQSSLTRLQTVTATKKAADDTLAQRKRERQQTKEKLEALRTTLQAERSKVAQLKKERERLARRAKVREAEFEKLKRQIAQKRQHVDPNEIKKEAKLKLSLAALTTERAKIAASIANLKALMGKESERYRSIVLQRKSEDQRITKYEAKLAELRKLTRKVEIVSQKSKKVERRLADLRQRVSDQSKTAMRLSQQLVAKRQALRAITTQLGEQAKKLARLKKRGKRRLARAQERKLKELKLQEGMARVKLAVETKKLEELTLSMKMQRSRLDQLAHLYAARVAKLKGLDRTERQKIAKLEGLDSETQKRIERLDALAKLTKVKESELRTQHSELKELALRKQKLADELEALKKKRTAEIEKLKNVANTNTSVTQQLQRLKELEARLNTKKDEIKGLLAKLKTARDKKEPTFEMPTGEVKTRDDKPTVVKLDRTLLDTPQPIKPKPEARDGLAKIRDIKYADSKERTIVTIKSPHQLHYKLVRKGGLQVLLLSGAKIPRLLERALDTSRRPSPVKLLSSFQDRKQKKNVKIVAAMRRGSVLSRVKVTNDGIQWIFEHKKTVVAKNDDDKSPFTIGPGPDTKDEVRIPTRVGAVKLSDISTITIDPKKRRYSGKKVNLTVKDADIQHVLTFLAKEGRVNIIAGSDVRGSVTFHLEDVPWELAFEKILESKSLGYTREGNIITVRPLDKIAKERELKVKTITKQREIEPLKVRIVPVNYAKAEELQQRIKSIKSKRGTVEVDKRTNTLIISDLDDHISAMIQLIRKLDLQTPQVLVETRIVEANIDFNRNIGIQWGGNLLFSQTTGNPTGLRFPSTLGIAGAADDQQNATNGLFVNTPNFVVNMPAPIGAGSGGGLGLTFGSLGGAANLALRLTALEDKGFLKIISSPRITTLDQVAAKISQGVSIPISVVSAAGVSTVFHQAVLQLQVTPHVTQDGNIHLKIQVSKNEPDFGNVGARGDPTILTKQAETELLVKDGETSVIGGIYTRNISRQSKKVPFFADIPVLGWFFRSKSESDKRTEMLIFITPRIVNRGKSLLKP